MAQRRRTRGSEPHREPSEVAFPILYGSLRQLAASGPGSFERLISDLLQAWTERRFHLCSSGRQAGRDASTAGEAGTWIAVECKRYRTDTALDERALIGEIVQCHQGSPELDLWVLVASKEVDEQKAQTIQRTAEDPQALMVRTGAEQERDEQLVGYCPRYLAQDLHGILEQQGATPSVQVERVNPPPALSQLRILCSLTERWPVGFRPLSIDLFRPVSAAVSVERAA